MINRWAGVSCNRCGSSAEILENAKVARAAARREGWKVALPGGVDFCPQCAPKETEQS